jgi:putative transposase
MVVRKRLKIAGPALVFVTTTTREWLPVFDQKPAADCITKQLVETIEYFHASLVGYSVMPTHIHALIGFTDLRLLSDFMESFKSISSRKIKQLDLDIFKSQEKASDSFRLWMPRFDDIVIKSDKQFRIKLYYIHNNPVKAGLVSKAIDWEYSSAGDWLNGKIGHIPIAKDFRWTG